MELVLYPGYSLVSVHLQKNNKKQLIKPFFIKSIYRYNKHYKIFHKKKMHSLCTYDDELGVINQTHNGITPYLYT